MATGLLDSSGADLDTILAPINGATPISNVGIQDTAGNDIATLFREVSAGTAPVANTGFQNSLSADIKTLFAEIGTTPPGVPASLGTLIAQGVDITDPGSVRAGIIFRTGGDIIRNASDTTTAYIGGNDVDIGDWVDTKTGLVSSEFEYNVTKFSGLAILGTAMHGDTDTWTTFSIDLDFYIQQTQSTFENTVVLNLKIREIANTANILLATINLHVAIGTP